jgi:methionyl-tRNA formyltransferase
MDKSKKLIFFGNERLATAVATTAPTLRALVNRGYQVAAVVSNYTPGVSRSDRRLEIVEVAHAYHIPVLMPEKPADIADKLKATGAEAGVLVAYGKIIPKEIINIFPKGIINIHPSLLPRLRGSTPIETAILDGLTETGVSLISLAAKMDAGPIYEQTKIRLSGRETKADLANKLLSHGAKLLIDNLPAILDGKLKSKPQKESQATYTKLLKKEAGRVDWGKSANVIEREIRAYFGWPRSTAKIHGQEIVITKARLAKDKNSGALVMPAKPGFLEIQELIGPSGRTMTGADFLRGYKA